MSQSELGDLKIIFIIISFDSGVKFNMDRLLAGFHSIHPIIQSYFPDLLFIMHVLLNTIKYCPF